MQPAMPLTAITRPAMVMRRKTDSTVVRFPEPFPAPPYRHRHRTPETHPSSARLTSVLSQKFALIQRDQKRFWPRRASEGLAIANANERNTGPGTFLTRPEGAPRMRHCDVAKLDKGLPLPAPRALHCHIRDALK